MKSVILKLFMQLKIRYQLSVNEALELLNFCMVIKKTEYY